MSPVDKPPNDDDSSNKSNTDNSNSSTSTASTADNTNASNTQANGGVDVTLSYGSLSDNASVVKNKLQQVRSYIQQTSTAMQGLEHQADMPTETSNQDEPVTSSALNSQNKGQVSSVTVDRLDFDSTGAVPHSHSNFSDRLTAGMAEATELTERLRDSVARREDLVDRYRATQQRLLALKRQRRDITQQERSLLLAQTNRDSFYEDAIPGASGWTLDELNTGLVDFRALYEKVSTLRSAYDTKINALAEGESAAKAEIEAKITQLETKKTQLVAIITQLKHLRAIRRSEQGLEPEEEEESTATPLNAPPTAEVLVTSSTVATTPYSSTGSRTVTATVTTGNSTAPTAALSTPSTQEAATVKQSQETEDTSDEADDSPISAVIAAKAQMVAAGQELNLRNQHLSNLKEELEGMKRLLDISQKTLNKGEGSSTSTAGEAPTAAAASTGGEVVEFVEGVDGNVLQLNESERRDPAVIAKYKQLNEAKKRMEQMASIMDVIQRGKGSGKPLKELLTEEQLAILEEAQDEDEEESAPPPRQTVAATQRGANARLLSSHADPRVRELLRLQDDLLQKSRNLDALMGEISNKDPANDLESADGEGALLERTTAETIVSEVASLRLPPPRGRPVTGEERSSNPQGEALSELNGIQSNIDRLYESLKEQKQQDHLLKVKQHQQTLQEHKHKLQEQQEKMAQHQQKMQLQQQEFKNQQTSQRNDSSSAASSQTLWPMAGCGNASECEGATAYLPPPPTSQLNPTSSEPLQSTLNQCLSQLYLHSLELQGLNKHMQVSNASAPMQDMGHGSVPQMALYPNSVQANTAGALTKVMQTPTNASTLSARNQMMHNPVQMMHGPMNQMIQNPMQMMQGNINPMVQVPSNQMMQNTMMQGPVNQMMPNHMMQGPSNQMLHAYGIQMMQNPANQMMQNPANQMVQSPANQMMQGPANQMMQVPMNQSVQAHGNYMMQNPMMVMQNNPNVSLQMPMNPFVQRAMSPLTITPVVEGTALPHRGVMSPTTNVVTVPYIAPFSTDDKRYGQQ